MHNRRNARRTRWLVASLILSAATLGCWMGLAYSVDNKLGFNTSLTLTIATAVSFTLAFCCWAIASE